MEVARNGAEGEAGAGSVGAQDQSPTCCPTSSCRDQRPHPPQDPHASYAGRRRSLLLGHAHHGRHGHRGHDHRVPRGHRAHLDLDRLDPSSLNETCHDAWSVSRTSNAIGRDLSFSFCWSGLCPRRRCLPGWTCASCVDGRRRHRRRGRGETFCGPCATIGHRRRRRLFACCFGYRRWVQCWDFRRLDRRGHAGCRGHGHENDPDRVIRGYHVLWNGHVYSAQHELYVPKNKYISVCVS